MSRKPFIAGHLS